MSANLSAEARRAKYEYNKKYQDSYWERRSQREQTTETKANGRTEKKTERTVNEVRIVFPKLPDSESVTFSRDGRSDEDYITALEKANKSMASENRRLIRLLNQYHEILKQGIYATFSNPEICEDDETN